MKRRDFISYTIPGLTWACFVPFQAANTEDTNKTGTTWLDTENDQVYVYAENEWSKYEFSVITEIVEFD